MIAAKRFEHVDEEGESVMGQLSRIAAEQPPAIDYPLRHLYLATASLSDVLCLYHMIGSFEPNPSEHKSSISLHNTQTPHQLTI